MEDNDLPDFDADDLLEAMAEVLRKEELEKLFFCRFRLGCYGERFEMILNRLTDSIKEQSKSSANNGEPPAKKARKNRYTETKF